MSSIKKPIIAIIGGGAAGFFAAINAGRWAKAAGLPVDIRIYEASGRFLKKVKISGGGRCNVTHNCFDVKRFCENYPRGQRELLSPMQRFQAKDTVEWFRRAGVELVAEEDGRMFPVSNSSETIIDCYNDQVKKLNIKLLTHNKITAIEKVDGGLQLDIADKESVVVSAVLLATGSVPVGYSLAESLGHSIAERAPSLFSFKIKDSLLSELSGLSFAQAEVKLVLPDKTKFSEKGPLLITHWGLSGPAVLKISAWAAREMKRANYQGQLVVNWLGMSLAEVQEHLQNLKVGHTKSQIKNHYIKELPKRFWLNVLTRCNIPHEKIWADVSKKEMNLLAASLQDCKLNVLGQNRFKDEFVECGGVSLPEVNFKTMQSKICPGLYFAGEILDIDGITGGFNFQNAWTTAWVAAEDMVSSLKNSPA